ncbi:hypothetical protein [Natronococcus wangiae]|uniref:hypothetical protein n=1 Tax=Natronococcus wangiae TaxID=3068275 RepID=UPI00273F007C|nr:hypothetical protein [Natronococcus sp. AD5]
MGTEFTDGRCTRSGLSDGAGAVFDEDFVARDARETRRLLHVGSTRVEDSLDI